MSEFVGNTACAECHAAEFQTQNASRHALTMRAADSASLGRLAPPNGPVDRAPFVIQSRNGRLSVSRKQDAPEAQELNFVLGSGKTGMTYVSVIGNAALLEMKRSYFPRWRRWETTPGQEKPHRGDGVFGHEHPTATARKCLGCHSVSLPVEGIAPEKRFFGVGCEACHGPGRDHIAAMRSGNLSDLHLERLERMGSTRLNEMCGKCHRTEQDINLSSPDARQTQRFQPYALVRAACRTESGDVLSCLTCHDPHANANPDHHTYEAACLKCHGPAAARAGGPETAKNCPVNSRSDCVRCHMPARNPFPHTNVPTTIVDHRISVPQQ